MVGCIFYLLAAVMAYFGAGDASIVLVFAVGMLCHWRGWGMFILGICGGYWLVRR